MFFGGGPDPSAGFALTSQMLREELQLTAPGIQAMLPAGEAVALVRVGGIFERLAGLPQRFAKGCRFLWRHLWIFVAVQDQQRGPNAIYIGEDVSLAIYGGFLFRCAAHLGLPPDPGVPVGVEQKERPVDYAVQLEPCGKQVRLFDHRIGNHGSAVAAAGNGDALRIGEALIRQVMRSGGDVVDLTSAGVFDVQVAELLAIAGAAAKIGSRGPRSPGWQGTDARGKT